MAVFPSVVNAAELLNTTTDLDRRGRLCALMTSLQDSKHTVLDETSDLLAITADQKRRRSPKLVIAQSRGATKLRRWLNDPAAMDAEAEGKALMREWLDASRDGLKPWRRAMKALYESGEVNLNGEGLLGHEGFSLLLYDRVPEIAAAARSPEEVHALIGSVSAWSWFAGAIAYEFHYQSEKPTKKQRKKAPHGTDMRQLIYLGLVNEFVCADEGLLAAARWVEGQVLSEMKCKVTRSDEFVERSVVAEAVLAIPVRP